MVVHLVAYLTGSDLTIRLAIIGCGNPARSDDGVGIEVIRMLNQQALAADIRLIDAGTSGMDVMFQIRGAQHVVIIDACRSGSDAGAIFRLPGSEAITPTEHRFNLHGLRWDHALYAGCKMFGEDFAEHVEVILVESQELGFGVELSAPVSAAAFQVVAMLQPLLVHNAA